MDKLTDQEKSVVLARMMGWSRQWTDSNNLVLVDSKGIGVGYRLMKPGEDLPNLYALANMALAWRVLNWAIWPNDISPDVDEYGTIKSYMESWWFRPEVGRLAPCYLSPALAQRAWLDKILELATEAGMIENGH